MSRSSVRKSHHGTQKSDSTDHRKVLVREDPLGKIAPHNLRFAGFLPEYTGQRLGLRLRGHVPNQHAPLRALSLIHI